MDLVKGAQVATYFVGIVTALFSLWQYRRNSHRERIRWLFELYQRFYEKTALREMRVRLDFGETEFISQESDKALLGDLDDYLNFFEFIAYLWRCKQLKRDEVAAMFEYPLQVLGKNVPALEYIRRYGFGELDKLLKEFGYAGQ